ncbi:MAG: PKD domain-containing protein [Vicingaceae bacterium]
MKSLFLLVIVLVSSFVSFAQQEASFDFNENKGQLDESIKYHCKLHIGDIFFKDNQFTFDLFSAEELNEFYSHKHHDEKEEGHSSVLNKHVYNMKFIGANSNNEIISSKKNKHYKNYFLGNDKSKWASNVNSYQKINYQNIYDGIDVAVYSIDNHLKYDFIVDAGAKTDDIIIKYEGVNELKLLNGILEIGLSNGKVRELKPFAYQMINGIKTEVNCEFVLDGNTLTFDFSNGYDVSKELIIDPTWEFSTLTGATDDNWGFTATYDNIGNFYAGGVSFTGSANGYPLVGPYQATFEGVVDVAISKFSANGTSLIYSTYLGGSEADEPHSLVVDDQDNLIIMGATSSLNFPVDNGVAYQDTFGGGSTITAGFSFNNGSDVFVTKFNATGNNLIGSTYLGGAGNDGLSLDANLNFNYADHARGEVILDANNNIYIASTSTSNDFPTTASSHSQLLSGGFDGVVAKLDPNLTSLLWGTYIGGTSGDAAYSIRIDDVNNKTFICGGTTSNDIGATAGVVNPNYAGAIDGFVARFDNTNGTLDALTYIGTPAYDQSYILEIDKNQDIYVVGQTKGVYPVTAGVYNNTGSAQFIHKLDNNLTTTDFSTVFGDSSNVEVDIAITAFLVDNCDNIYVAGWGGLAAIQEGNTFGLPTTPNALQDSTDGRDFYFIVLDRDAQNLVYATFFGEYNTNPSVLGEHVDGGTSRFDKSGTIYQAVCAGCGGNNFPTSPGAFSSTNGSTNCNYGAIKIDMNLPIVVAQAVAPPDQVVCGVPYSVDFDGGNPVPPNSYWDFGDMSGTASNINTPNYTYADTGSYNVMYVAIDSNTCNIADTVYFNVSVNLRDTLDFQFNIPPYDPCVSSLPIQLDFIGDGADSLYWDMGDGTTFTNISTVNYTYTTAGGYLLRFEAYDTLCNNTLITTDSIFFTPNRTTINATQPPPIELCTAPYLVNFNGNNPVPPNSYWDFGDMSGTAINNNNPSYTYADTGSYNVMYVAIDSLTCNIADTVYFNVDVNLNDTLSAEFNIPPYNPCADSLPIQLNFTGSGADSLYWNMGDGTTFTNINTVNYTYHTNGQFIVSLEAFDTLCNNTFTEIDTVTFMPNRTVVNATPPEPVLLCSAPYSISLMGNNPAPPNSYWNFGDQVGTVVDDNAPTYTYQNTGVYTVMYVAIDSNTCNIADTAYFNVELATPQLSDLSIAFDENDSCQTTDFEVKLNFGDADADSLFFDLGDGTQISNQNNTVHLYKEPGTYLIKMSAFNYLCNVREDLEEEVVFTSFNEIGTIIPNVFTPNGDGMNDKLQFFNIDQTAEYNVQIFNRWGKKVYEGADALAHWDGGDANEGTYFYVLKYRIACNDEEREVKGTVTLLR